MLSSRIPQALGFRQLQNFAAALPSCASLQTRQSHHRAPRVCRQSRECATLGSSSTSVLSAAAGAVRICPSVYLGCVGGGADGWHQSRGFSTSSRRCAKVLSEKGDVVYRGTISGMIKGVKVFSLSTSAIGICLQPFLLFSNQELPTGLKVALGGFVNFFVFMNPLIIHYIAKKYVTELRWNRSTGVFTAVTWSFLLQRQETAFTADHVKVPDVPGMFTFLEAKGKPLFFDPQAFENEEAYVHMMGYDKPLDWELPPREEEGGSSSSSATQDSQKR